LSILLNEALAEYYAEQGLGDKAGQGDVILRDAPNTHTRLVFVDAANASFRQALEQSTPPSPRPSAEVFVVLKSKRARQTRLGMLGGVAHLLYKD
ncbi:hypothetical protein PGS49_23685, partial [Yersinia intermedia]|uniref:hypothetical protein n=1 Tax=Yersinia intermedia TaxID=631 RepID=UPI0022FDD52D